MSDRFLIVEIDAHGMTATIVRQVSKKSHIDDTCRVSYQTLPEAKTAQEYFGSALDFLIDHLDMRSCTSAIVIIPSSSVSFRKIEMPFKSVGKIRQILPLEVASVLPAAQDIYSSDFHILDIPYEKGHVPVFTASVSQSEIDMYRNILLAHGIKPGIITPKGYAAACGILKKIPSVTHFICLDLGSDETTITLVYNRQPFFVRSFPASQYTPEELPDTVKQSLLGFRQTTGMDTCFDLFITSDQRLKKFEKTIYGLENLIHYQTRFMKKDEARHPVPRLKKFNSTGLMAALHPKKDKNALINFFQPDTGFTPIFQKNRTAILTSICLAGILLICSLYYLNLQIRDLNERIDKTRIKAVSIYKTTFPGKKDPEHPLLQMKALVKTAVKKSTGSDKNMQIEKQSRLKAAQVMAALSDTIPNTIDMEITNFLLTRTTLVISGTTDNFKTVDRIKGFIEKGTLFKQISINSASADKKSDLVRFKFTIQLLQGAS